MEGISTEKEEEIQMLDIFSGVQKELDNELDLKEKIRLLVHELEQTARGISTAMQAVHQCPRDEVPALCKKLRPMFDPAREVFKSLSDLIHEDMYFKFNEQWRNVCQKLAFLSALLVYLESGTLASREQVGQHLGIATGSQQGMHLELDDYLVGLLSMCSELSRLAVNSVILGDFSRPFEIATFTSDLTAGFRLLNLKNDFLRKKYDALKYDVKKIEEVVYDISIRGLKPSPSSAAN